MLWAGRNAAAGTVSTGGLPRRACGGGGYYLFPICVAIPHRGMSHGWVGFTTWLCNNPALAASGLWVDPTLLFCQQVAERRASPSEAREPPGRLQAQLFSPPHALSQLVTGGRDQEF